MVNEIILKYLRENLGKFKTEDLRQKILSRGYTAREFEEVVSFIQTQERISAKKNRFKEPFFSAAQTTLKNVPETSKPQRGLFLIGLFSLIFLILALTLTSLTFFEPLKFQKLSQNMGVSLSLAVFSIFSFSLLQNIGFFIIGRKTSKLLKLSTLFSFILVLLMFTLILSKILSAGVGIFLTSSLSSLFVESSPLFIVGLFSLIVLWVLSKLLFVIAILRLRNQLKSSLLFGLPLLVFLIVLGIYLVLIFYLAINVSLLTKVLLDLAEGMPGYLSFLRSVGIFALALWVVSFFTGVLVLFRAQKNLSSQKSYYK